MDVQFAAQREARHVAVELATAKQKPQLDCFALVARLATGIGRDALRHQLYAQPCRQAAVGLIEQAVGAYGQAGSNLFFVNAQHLIDENHVAGMGDEFGERPLGHGASPIIRLMLLPPKANELLIM